MSTIKSTHNSPLNDSYNFQKVKAYNGNLQSKLLTKNNSFPLKTERVERKSNINLNNQPAEEKIYFN